MWTPLMLPVMLAAALGLVPSLPVGGDDTGNASPTESRPYALTVPASYDKAKATPLLVLLHGYTSDGAGHTAYFRLAPVAEREGFLLAAPDGTKDQSGSRFWNATDACCNFFGSDVDDVAYLDAVIDEISDQYNVDEDRVYLAGHSNGGFMAHRFACDRAERVAAIVSLAGAQWADPERCQPSADVSVLQVHGTDDNAVKYEGDKTPAGRYPGAEATVGTWADKNGCGGDLEAVEPNLDIEPTLAGAETAVARFSGCPKSAVELWTVNGGSHSPTFDDRWPAAIWGFMAAHPRAG